MFLNLPERIILLGYSGSTLSIVFERLKKIGYQGEIVIVKNQDVCDEVPFENGQNYILNNIRSMKDPEVNSCFLAVTNPVVKRKVYEVFLLRKAITEDFYFSFPDPCSSVASTSKLEGAVGIEAGVVVSPFAELKFGVTVARNSSIGHHVLLNQFVTVNPGVHIAGHCSIGENTTIGIGAVVFDHITIGKNCKIGGGSVVTKDIPDHSLAYGNPCRVIRKIKKELADE